MSDHTGQAAGSLVAQKIGAALSVSEPLKLPAMPHGRAMQIIDELLVRAPIEVMFDLAREVEHWPAYLSHYRWVRFEQRASDGGGVVSMAAWRPFGIAGWPTWWKSEMTVDSSKPAIRFRHVGGVTTGMDVEWTFVREHEGTRVRIEHVWDGPHWPLVGVWAAINVIGPVFIHGIASRTLAGLAAVAERFGKG